MTYVLMGLDAKDQGVMERDLSAAPDHDTIMQAGRSGPTHRAASQGRPARLANWRCRRACYDSPEPAVVRRIEAILRRSASARPPAAALGARTPGRRPRNRAFGLRASGPDDRVLTFYLRCASGTAISFVVADIASEEMAASFARKLFALDETAVLIDVFEGDALVCQFSRARLCSVSPIAHRIDS
jgi:hypothetical protein